MEPPRVAKEPPTRTWPVGRTAREPTEPPLEARVPRTIPVSRVPSVFRRAKWLLAVALPPWGVMVEKMPPKRILPLDWTATVPIWALAPGVKEESRVPSVLMRAM